jgi:hypothetical protein
MKKPSTDKNVMQAENWIPGIETVAGALAKPVLSAAAEQAVKAVIKEGPISVRILQSYAKDQKHIIKFMVKNNTIHGTYIESASATPSGEFKNENSGAERTTFPCYLGPYDGSSDNFRYLMLSIPLGTDRALKTDLYGSLTLEVSRLDQKKVERIESPFRLRGLL